MIIQTWRLCLEHHEEINESNILNIAIQYIIIFNDKYKKGNDIFIKAFHIFKILTDTVDKLIIPMELTDEVLNTQFYDNRLII